MKGDYSDGQVSGRQWAGKKWMGGWGGGRTDKENEGLGKNMTERRSCNRFRKEKQRGKRRGGERKRERRGEG